VEWTAVSQPRGEQTEVTVSLAVEVSGFCFSAAGYQDLKEFLGWVEEASSRVLLLEKKPS
jgi:hypothetical protein